MFFFEKLLKILTEPNTKTCMDPGKVIEVLSRAMSFISFLISLVWSHREEKSFGSINNRNETFIKLKYLLFNKHMMCHKYGVHISYKHCITIQNCIFIVKFQNWIYILIIILDTFLCEFDKKMLLSLFVLWLFFICVFCKKKCILLVKSLTGHLFINKNTLLLKMLS